MPDIGQRVQRLMATGDTVLTDDSLLARPEGLGIALTVPWYRSLWLSSVSRHRGRGRRAARSRRPTCGSSWGSGPIRVDELADQWDVLWFIQDRLVVVVPLDEPPAEGQEVDVEVTVDLRLPYMQIAPTKYVTNHASNRGPSSRTERPR